MFKNNWDKIYTGLRNKKIVYDDWLDDYKEIIANCTTPVLDLGCGCGNNSLYLTKQGIKVIACDYSTAALEIVKKNMPEVETKCFDISHPLPFENNTFELIIADLSLHYFYSQTTKNILNEIKRILKPNGVLLARVNSIYDINYGAKKGELLENNYYFVNGHNKRFFSLEDAKEYFSLIGNTEIKEDDMNRYEMPKKVIVIKAQNINH